MVIHNFHIARVASVPYKTDSPLIVHPDAVLSFAIALERPRARLKTKSSAMPAAQTGQSKAWVALYTAWHKMQSQRLALNSQRRQSRISTSVRQPHVHADRETRPQWK